MGGTCTFLKKTAAEKDISLTTKTWGTIVNIFTYYTPFSEPLCRCTRKINIKFSFCPACH